MSYSPAPKYKGATAIAAYDPVAEANQDIRFLPFAGRWKALLIGETGDATPPEITLYMSDGSQFTIKNPVEGQTIEVDFVGVAASSANMFDIWGLY
jgi:hypothetical protein